MPLRASNVDLGVGGGGPEKGAARDNLFWWTVFLISLAGAGIACWVGSFYVFGHPEKARPYRILTRLGKLPPPVRFLVTKAPPGEFWGAQRVFEQYSKFTSLQLERENETLFRNYLRNYSENKRPVRYLTGTFTILKAYELQDSDLINSGVVALSQAEEFPQLLVELLYPTPRDNVPALLQMLRPGLGVKLEKTLDLSAILHVGHALDGRLQVTTVPLLYGSYAVLNGNGTFSLQPPTGVNVAAGFPLVRGEEVRSVLFEQLESRRRRVVSKEPLGPEPASLPQLVRVNPEVNREEGLAPVTQGVATSGSSSGSSSDSQKSASMPGEDGKKALASASDLQSGARNPAGTPGAKVVGGSGVGTKQEQPKTEPDRRSLAGAAREVAVAEPVAEKVVAAVGAAEGGDSKVNSSKARSVYENPVAQAFAAAPPPAGAVAPGRSAEISKTTAGARAMGSGGSGVVPAQPLAASKSGSKADLKASIPSKEGQTSAVSAVSSSPGSRPEVVVLAQNQSGPVNGAKAPSGEAKAFVAAAPAAMSINNSSAQWKTYGAGQQPGGRVVSTEQATAYADRTDAGRLYLRGQFVVTATGNGRAVLRQARTDDRSPAARVIVEYPAGAVPPAQGSSIARDDGRGFEIREVRKSPDGQVNIFVREISAH